MWVEKNHNGFFEKKSFVTEMTNFFRIIGKVKKKMKKVSCKSLENKHENSCKKSAP